MARARTLLNGLWKTRACTTRGWGIEVDGALQVRITGNQGSGVLSSMVQANGLIVLHHAQSSVAAGGDVDVMMFDGAI